MNKTGFSLKQGMILVAVFIVLLVVLSLLFPDISLKMPSFDSFSADNFLRAVAHFVFNLLKDFIDKII